LRLCTMKVAFVFWGPTGDSVEAVTVGEATDTGDKAPNKAHSAALKVALCQLLLIPFDSQDPDDQRQEFAPSAREERPRPQPAEPPAPETCTECGAEFQRTEKKQGRRGAFKHLECPTTAPEQVQAVFEGAQPLDTDPF
jgi:hypothetical protein